MQTRECCEEGRLAVQQAKLKCRCSKALGTKPSQRQLSQNEVRYYEWCLSDAALHQERPEWMAEASPTRNANSGDAHHAPVLGVNPQPADCRAKHPDATARGVRAGCRRLRRGAPSAPTASATPEHEPTPGTHGTTKELVAECAQGLPKRSQLKTALGLPTASVDAASTSAAVHLGSKSGNAAVARAASGSEPAPPRTPPSCRASVAFVA